ncbi:hypothetical protein BD413DRAFT_34303 [Trametes elegans]|nr:hypothetical protein BD413DRAFT_34303 [Trametes elegans]
MAVVIASSHCHSTMPSNEPLRTPSRAQAQGATVASSGVLSETQESIVVQYNPTAQDDTVDETFFTQHLTGCPQEVIEKAMKLKDVRPNLNTIMRAKGKEQELYGPIADLLTAISGQVFESLPTNLKARVPSSKPIVFLDHHTSRPTHFPIDSPDDKPDIIGAFAIDHGFEDDSRGITKGIPYHRVETIVEAKAIYGKDGKAQAARYAYRVQQARPDRPGFYCLSVKPQHFQVVYSSPCGLEVSEHTSWEEVDKLCAYIYSLYVPPAGHFLYDRTITWKESRHNELGAPTWTVKAGGKVYKGAELIFLGNPWRRRTMIFRAPVPGHTPAIIKEYYHSSDRRYKEDKLLQHAHAEGSMPGLVRSVWGDAVKYDRDHELAFTDGKTTKTKRRLVLVDMGYKLECAKSINDLLMTAYDVLEVHRTLVRERSILHRDMSLFNILMYPKWSSWPEVQALGHYKDHPALIDEVLAGKSTDPDKRMARCLLIDLDNGAMIDDGDPDVTQDELGFRTGTPMYIARAVAAGEVVSEAYTSKYKRMPLLSGKALELYLATHGEDRYNRYNDNESTFHGGIPPDAGYVDDNFDQELGEVADTLPFYHRWEYDAESVYWTLFSVLIRVLPEDAEFSPGAQQNLAQQWTRLASHTISDTPNSDSRPPILQITKMSHICPLFAKSMHDVALMLLKMSAQVAPSYALMPQLPPHDDHLHEAMQRLILDYLVTHLDNPIPLTGELRETGQPTQQVAAVDNYRPPEEKKSTVTSSKRRRAEEESAQAQTSSTGSQRESQNRPSVQLRRSDRLLSKNEPLAMAPPPLPALFAAPPDQDGPAEADEAPAPKRRR